MNSNNKNTLLKEVLYYAFRRYKARDMLIERTEKYFTSLPQLLFATEDDFYFLEEKPRKSLYEYIILLREICIRFVDLPPKTLLKEDTLLPFLHMLYARLCYLKTESILALFFNKRKAFNGTHNIATGSDRKAFFDKKLLLQKLQKTKSTYCIIAHNHPSGIEQPSPADIKITKELVEELDKCSFYLVDHVIISKYAIYSILQGKIIASLSF